MLNLLDSTHPDKLDHFSRICDHMKGVVQIIRIAYQWTYYCVKVTMTLSQHGQEFTCFVLIIGNPTHCSNNTPNKQEGPHVLVDTFAICTFTTIQSIHVLWIAVKVLPSTPAVIPAAVVVDLKRKEFVAAVTRVVVGHLNKAAPALAVAVWILVQSNILMFRNYVF